MKTNTIWLIDDNEIDNYVNNVLLMKFEFSKNVLDFNTIKSAELKVKRLLKKDGNSNEVPNILFLDINFPIGTGFDFLRDNEDELLHMNPGLKTIFLTTSLNPDDATQATKFVSFLKFITKPLTVETINELKATLQA